jgi:hypothetical protein
VRSDDGTSVIPALDWNYGTKYGRPRGVITYQPQHAIVGTVMAVLEPRHERVPLLEKPFGAVQLRVLLEELVGPGSPTGNRSRGISA